MALALHQPGLGQAQGLPTRRQPRTTVLCVRAQTESAAGPTGLNVKGHRPTSSRGWQEMAAELKAANLKLLSPQELLFAKDKGAVIIDIRFEADYEQGHIPDARNIPFFQPIQGWTPWQVARRVGFAAFGILNGTEPNPNFMSEVKALVCAETEAAGMILYCGQGGSLEPSISNKTGKQTRSMVAAYSLIQAGVPNVGVLKGGFSEWLSSGRDISILVPDA